MSFLAPAFLLAAGVVAGLVIALHFIVTREPRTAPLPTTRFVPDRPVRAQSRAIRLQDFVLLCLRVALILAVGAALARPVLNTARDNVARIVLVDRSRAVASEREVADSARALVRSGEALVLFDTAVVVVHSGAGDSLASLRATQGSGRLSAALVVALRTASVLRESADSIEIALISPLVEEEFDAATDSIRALWPGAIRIVRVAARAEPAAPVIGLVARPDDPIRLALPSYALDAPEATVRLVRDALGTLDSAWASESARVLVHWPVDPNAFSTPGLLVPVARRQPTDTVGAVVAGDEAVVAPFERSVSLEIGDARSAVELRTGRVVARWVDGEPAAVERPLGRGCVRAVGIPVPVRGDLVLTPRFARLVRVLTEPCGGQPALAPVSATRVASLAGVGSTALVARASIVPARTRPTPLARWLLLLALALFAAELVARSRMTRALEPS